jgi:hypothetical protein
MSRRLEFHQILKEVLGSDHVYFQPPADVKMKYPAIVYKRQAIDAKLADDQLYGTVTGYMVSVIDTNPDSEIPGKILELPMSRFNRHYTANNLNHDIFSIYY